MAEKKFTDRIGRLTATKIAKFTKNGFYGDGGNLHMQVTGHARSWVFRWTDRVTGKERVMGLGSYKTVNIETAREYAEKYRLALLEGKDPKAVRDEAKAANLLAQGKAKTLVQVAVEWFDTMIAPTIRSKKNRYTLKSWIQIYIRDKRIGNRSVGDLLIEKVTTNILFDECGLRALWSEKNHTAQKVFNFFDRIFQYGINHHNCHMENPAAWKKIKGLLPPAHQVHRVQHHKAAPYKQIGKYLQQLRNHTYAYEGWKHQRGARPTQTLLIEMFALTGCRSGEARQATWQEFDRSTLIWTVPPEHLKSGHIHGKSLRRPITKSMVAILDAMEQRHPDHAADALVFPGPRDGGVISEQAPGAYIKAHFKWDFDLHGLRSTLRNWCVDKGPPNADKLWMIQADHVDGNKASQAYGHDDQLEKRTRMMEQWDEYCSRPAPEPEAGKVIELADKRRQA